MSDVCMIVARYEENLKWLDFLPKNIKVIIYNKGKDITEPKYLNNPNITIHNKCNNTGRESETYLRYIISNYNNLPDIIIFTQGYPLDHAPNFSHLCYLIANDEMASDILPMTVRWNHEIPPPLTYEHLTTPYLIEKASRYTLCPLTHWDEGVHGIHYDYINLHELQNGTDVIHHFCGLINLPDHNYGQSDLFEFFYCGIFAVKKEAILKHSYDFYFNCHSINSKNTVYGYLFERIWYTMFTV